LGSFKSCSHPMMIACNINPIALVSDVWGLLKQVVNVGLYQCMVINHETIGVTILYLG
jgi:hypothetical protein